MAPPSRKSVRELGSELIEVLKSQGIKVYKLTKGERDAFKNSVKGIDKEIVEMLGGESKKIYELILKGKKEFKKKGHE